MSYIDAESKILLFVLNTELHQSDARSLRYPQNHEKQFVEGKRSHNNRNQIIRPKNVIIKNNKFVEDIIKTDSNQFQLRHKLTDPTSLSR